MSNKCLIFSDLVPVMHIKSHAVTSGNCCVSSVVTSSCMTPINEIITDFSKHTRYPAGYSVSSLHTPKIRKVCKTFRQFGPISALLYNNLWCSSLSPNEDAVKMLEREVHHMRAEMDLPKASERKYVIIEQWNPSPFTNTYTNSKSTSDILTETTAKQITQKKSVYWLKSSRHRLSKGFKSCILKWNRKLIYIKRQHKNTSDWSDFVEHDTLVHTHTHTY